MGSVRAIDVFMRRIIDYAGMYPPARLPFEKAAANYREYQRHRRADFLGAFVTPIDHLAEAPDPCTALVGQVPGSPIGAKSIEVPFQNDPQAFLLQAEKAFPDARRIFVELDWRNPFEPAMAALASRRTRFCLKLRTGGVTPEAIPPSEAIADFLIAAARHNLPLKATAGLHVPVPNEDPAVGVRMHGFLNFFAAGFLAYTGHGGRTSIIATLDRLSYDDFHFTDELSFGNYSFSIPEIVRLRAECLLSFGSCSFLEPIRHLEQHGFLNS
jgi:hypothetical protein